MFSSRIFIILSLLLCSFHPIHVSLANVEIKENEKLLHVVFKFDKESFRFAFLHGYLYDIRLEDAVLDEKSKRFLNDYIGKCFIVKLDNEEVFLNFEKHETRENEVWFYYRKKIKLPKESILVRNLLLFDVNLNQSNVLIIKTSNFERGYLLNKDRFEINVDLSGESK